MSNVVVVTNSDSTVVQESGLLQAASPFYKTFAIECSRAQVSVDMFLFSAGYQDVATLGEYYVLFNLEFSSDHFL